MARNISLPYVSARLNASRWMYSPAVSIGFDYSSELTVTRGRFRTAFLRVPYWTYGERCSMRLKPILSLVRSKFRLAQTSLENGEEMREGLSVIPNVCTGPRATRTRFIARAFPCPKATIRLTKHRG